MMMSDKMAETLAAVFRQQMTIQMEQNHQPQIGKQWQREWQDTDQAYRDVWHRVAVAAQEAVCDTPAAEPEPEVSDETVSLSDYEPEPEDFRYDEQRHGGATLDQSDELY